MKLVETMKFFAVGMLGVLMINCVTADSFNEKANKLELDLAFVAEHAKEAVDIVFVLDVSGSISNDEFNESKKFVRNYLDYFSIAPGHSQVGVVLFSSSAITAIRLKTDGNKCEFMTELVKMERWSSGGTNTKAGLSQAWDVLKKDSRYNTANSQRFVVLVTDGDWNDGGDPRTIVESMKDDPGPDGGILIMVVSVGVSGSVSREMESWASQLNGKPMVIPVSDTAMLVHLAYAIHKGTHKSKYIDVDQSECSAIKEENCGSSSSGQAQCICDSFGSTGKPQCGCGKGQQVSRNSNKVTCEPCIAGTYQDARNLKQFCKGCPKLQTTISVGSTARADCRCKEGFQDPTRKSKIPTLNAKCQPVKCAQDEPDQLNGNHVSKKGTCTYMYGQDCHYVCRVGYSSVDIMKRTCLESGVMSPRLPNCTSGRCGYLPNVNSQEWSCNLNGTSRNPPYIFRTVCTNRCNLGYVPARGTKASVECRTDQQNNFDWSGKPLECVARECLPLPEIVNGYYNFAYCTDPLKARPLYAKCGASCKPGYRLSRDVIWQCSHSPSESNEWTNSGLRVTCKDIETPVFNNCPNDVIKYSNSPNEAYYRLSLGLLDVSDNEDTSLIEQSVSIKQPDRSPKALYSLDDYSYADIYIGKPGEKAEVEYTAVDQAGNKATCKYFVVVEDTEGPTVHQCDGPDTKNGVIETSLSEADVKWKEPVFYDNSGRFRPLESNLKPGQYPPNDEIKKVIYTATDYNGNTNNCSFSFKVVSKKENCPHLHRPANGFLVCSTLAFGYFCSVTCRKGLYRQEPGHTELHRSFYLCQEGAWNPNNIVGDCRAKVTGGSGDGYAEVSLIDYCENDLSKKEIIDQFLAETDEDPAIKLLLGNFSDQEIYSFPVFCGANNHTILAIDDGN